MAGDSDDLDQGLQFVHTMGMQTKAEAHDNAATIYALIEELLARGLVDLRSLEERRERTRAREGERARAMAHVTIADDVDKYALADLPVIDCAARLPLCKARCCTLGFSLSRQDLDEGMVRWDYSKPYQIRRKPDGYCVHNDQSRGCQLYAQRPAVCRTYDCREDKRIWQDFEKRIPAPVAPDEK